MLVTKIVEKAGSSRLCALLAKQPAIQARIEALVHVALGDTNIDFSRLVQLVDCAQRCLPKGSARATRLVQELASKEADTNGRNALNHACYHRLGALALDLMRCGSEINPPGESIFRPFHEACSLNPDYKNRRLAGRLALTLFSAGADPSVKNSDGQLPAQLIKEYALRTAFNLPQTASGEHPWDRLPREVRAMIYRRVDDGSVFSGLGATCRAFRIEVIEELCRSFFQAAKEASSASN